MCEWVWINQFGFFSFFILFKSRAVREKRSPSQKKTKKTSGSNYITSTQSIETKVIFFFCLVAFMDKALTLAPREQKPPLGFTFLWRASRRLPVIYQATLWSYCWLVMNAAVSSASKSNKRKLWSLSHHNKTSLNFITFQLFSLLDKYKRDIKWDETESVRDAGSSGSWLII